MNCIALAITQILGHLEMLPDWTGDVSLACFGLISLILTYISVREVSTNQQIKIRDGYKFCETDYCFTSTRDVCKLAFFCGVAAVLCGCTGIAGGMVLGPLFLTYGMPPSVMSATNQYISMVAALSVSAQFVSSGGINYE